MEFHFALLIGCECMINVPRCYAVVQISGRLVGGSEPCQIVLIVIKHYINFECKDEYWPKFLTSLTLRSSPW
jgi:hypothetical protein